MVFIKRRPFGGRHGVRWWWCAVCLPRCGSGSPSDAGTLQ